MGLFYFTFLLLKCIIQIKLVWFARTGYTRMWLYIQLNEYETALYFLQLSQNMISDCLFIFVFFPVFTWIYLFWAQNCSKHQIKTIFGAKQVNSGKNGEKHKVNKHLAAMFWLDWRNYGAVQFSKLDDSILHTVKSRVLTRLI